MCMMSLKIHWTRKDAYGEDANGVLPVSCRQGEISSTLLELREDFEKEGLGRVMTRVEILVCGEGENK